MQPEEYQLKGEFCKYDDYNTNPEWGMCVMKMRQNLIAATCIAAMIATLGERLFRAAFGDPPPELPLEALGNPQVPLRACLPDGPWAQCIRVCAHHGTAGQLARPGHRVTLVWHLQPPNSLTSSAHRLPCSCCVGVSSVTSQPTVLSAQGVYHLTPNQMASNGTWHMATP